MGMSTHVEGFVPPDDQWHKMKAIWDSCRAAKISVPIEVEKFFNDDAPDDAGMRIDLHQHPAVSKYSDGDRCASGIQVELEKLPPQVKFLRFVNSW